MEGQSCRYLCVISHSSVVPFLFSRISAGFLVHLHAIVLTCPMPAQLKLTSVSTSDLCCPRITRQFFHLQMPPRHVHAVTVPLLREDRERYDAVHAVAQSHFEGTYACFASVVAKNALSEIFCRIFLCTQNYAGRTLTLRYRTRRPFSSLFFVCASWPATRR